MKKTKKKPTAGSKDDSQKLMVDLVPPLAVMAIARGLTYGAIKYSPHNFRRGIKISRLMAALERHWLKWKSGEDFDADSNLEHLDSIASTLAMIIEMKFLRPDLDDRYDTMVRWDKNDKPYLLTKGKKNASVRKSKKGSSGSPATEVSNKGSKRVRSSVSRRSVVKSR